MDNFEKRLLDKRYTAVNHLKLTDLISMERLQEIERSLADFSRMGAIITDENGQPITEGSNFSEFCQEFCRKNPLGKKRCEQCDRMGGQMALEKNGPVSYTCHAGLEDFSAPILFHGRVLGYVIGGQVLTGPLDEVHLREIAGEMGIDADAFIESAKKVQIIPKAAVDRGAKFVYSISETLSEIAGNAYITMEYARQAYEAGRARSDFVANMSHEIRTPMNAVLGMAQLALREEMSPKVRKYIHQISESGKMLLTIINDILDYSKVESGKMELIEDSYNLKEVMEELSTIIKVRIADKPVEYILNLDENIPAGLYGDEVRIKQVIINIANNAVKFTEKGSVTITVGYSELEPDEETGEPKVELTISIKDTGIGIKDYELPAIFESFQQVDSKRNREVEGTGLGLAIVKNLLALMDGYVTVKSKYGEGSEFVITIPQKVTDTTPIRDWVPTEEDTEEDERQFIAPQAKILVVDDNQINLDIVVGMLEPNQIQIDTALSGLKSIERLAKGEYDLVFMDHMMPGMDGVDTTRLIRNRFKDRADMPIIALTANVLTESIAEFKKVGMNDYLPKPVEYVKLLRTLKEWLPQEKIVYTDEAVGGETETIDIPGLDTEFAIRLMGTKKLYLSTVRDFYKFSPKKLESIKSAFATRRCKDFTIDVHALKSSLKQIGAIEASDLAARLEAAGNDEDWNTITNFMPDLIFSVEKCQEAIRPTVEELEKQEEAEKLEKRLAKEQGQTVDYFINLQDFIEKMTEGLNNLDMDTCTELMSQLEEQGLETFGVDADKLGALKEAIEGWDFDTSQGLLQELG